MIIFEPIQNLECETPKGRGRIWLVTEYGSEMPKIFTVIISETGEVWEFKNSEVRITPNQTMTGFLNKTKSNTKHGKKVQQTRTSYSRRIRKERIQS